MPHAPTHLRRLTLALATLLAALFAAAALHAAPAKPAPPIENRNSKIENPPLPLSDQIPPQLAKLPPAPTLPKNLKDLKAIQTRVEEVAKLVLPATVSIQLPFAQGSGIIVSKDGYVLTAGHVSGTPGDTMSIVLADGRRVHAIALGANNDVDSGLVKITDQGDYPFVPVGSTKNLVAGQWLVALGHPGGFVRGRPPVLRLGRVLISNKAMLGTDCPLISGDSGGPVFDLDGRLVGINSRIGPTTTMNIHVPIDNFTSDWTRLANSDQWGGTRAFIDLSPRRTRATTLGIHAVPDDRGAKITLVRRGTPAQIDGLHEGDIITALNGQPIKTPADLALLITRKRPGDSITLTLLRNDKPLDLTIHL